MKNYKMPDARYGVSGNYGGFHPAFISMWDKQYAESTWGDESQPRGWGTLRTTMKAKTGRSRLTNKVRNFRLRESPEVIAVQKHRLALVIKLRPAHGDNGQMFISSEVPDGKGGYAGIFTIRENDGQWFAKFVVYDGDTLNATPEYQGKSPQMALAKLCGAKRWFKCGEQWHSLYDLYPEVRFFGFRGDEQRPKQNTTRLETQSHGFWFYENWLDIKPIIPAVQPSPSYNPFKPTGKFVSGHEGYTPSAQQDCFKPDGNKQIWSDTQGWINVKSIIRPDNP